MSHPYIAFIPGLQGTGANMPERTGFRYDQPATQTNARIIYDIAHANDVPFFFLNYQSRENPFPLFSDMGDDIASQLLSLQMQFERPGLMITSGTGTAVSLQALASSPLLIPREIISLKGVFDLVRGVEGDACQNLGKRAILYAVRNGCFDPYNLHLTPSVQTPNPGVFPITTAHLNDPRLFHPLGNHTQQNQFTTVFEKRKLPFLRLTGTDDDSELAFDFRNQVGDAISTQCIVDIVGPITNGLITAQVKQRVIEQTLRPKS